MKQLLTLLAVATAAAAITYLAVINRQTEERARRLAREVAAAEERSIQLEEELRQAQQRLRQMAESQPPVNLQTTSQRVQAQATSIETRSTVSVPSTVNIPVVAHTAPAILPIAVPVNAWKSDWIRYEAQPGGSSCTDRKSVV